MVYPNLKDRLFFAAKNPAYSVRAVLRDLLLADERFLAPVTGKTATTLRSFLHEPFEQSWFLAHLQSCESFLKGVESVGAHLYAKKILLQYAIARAVQPEVIVETGVANGVSSAYLLLALHLNRKGQLHSIDLADGSFCPLGKSVGWIVPPQLRERWHLHIGDAEKLLPDLLSRIGELDIFIHDSLHTYEHMKFEFQQAYPRIRRGGLLVADDASWNSAFSDFARAVRAPAAILRGVGVLGK